jgi:hypothetical protein
MPHYLLVGAGFTRNWDGPLSDEITGSLLGELSDYPEIAAALRSGPFEDVFQGFQQPTVTGSAAAGLKRFQDAVTELFARLNKSLLKKTFEFSSDVEFSIKRFLAKFDGIFSLNQDLLLEAHYLQTFISQGMWSGVVVPGMAPFPPPAYSGPIDQTMYTWQPTSNIIGGSQFQPFYKLHGSSNWRTESGEPLLIMGNA